MLIIPSNIIIIVNIMITLNKKFYINFITFKYIYN